ncbi:MAG: hypothetical protein HY557_05300 [Euryarchaeota archaeon]|nr:hypothetical protein [Euryarchaeota archaeon]
MLSRADRLVILFAAAWVQLLLDPAGRGVGLAPLGFTPLTWTLLLFAVLGQLTAIQRGISSWRRLGAM